MQKKEKDNACCFYWTKIWEADHPIAGGSEEIKKKLIWRIRLYRPMSPYGWDRRVLFCLILWLSIPATLFAPALVSANLV
jgi:hypothetical protein